MYIEKLSKGLTRIHVEEPCDVLPIAMINIFETNKYHIPTCNFANTSMVDMSQFWDM